MTEQQRNFINRLQPGDILLAGGGEPHTMMYVGVPPRHYIVHAAGYGYGIVIDNLTDENDGYYEEDGGPLDIFSHGFYAFRPTDFELALRASQLATGWAVTRERNENGGGTKYSGSRYYGVKAEAARHGDIGFDFEAVYRIFKWASRQNERFSEHGATCCAFVTACYQTAGLLQRANGNGVLIRRWFNRLEKDRQRENISLDRMAGRRIINGQEFRNKPLREYVNVGSRYEARGLDYWRHITQEMFGDPVQPAEIMTEAMVVDAKFNWTQNLRVRVARDTAGWRPVGYLAPPPPDLGLLVRVQNTTLYEGPKTPRLR